ncbi:hypothetical protein LPJ61_003135 [Coemansia biformis]|uniref:Uncharacterized protein n=1 Tax=Coemansia biformis TaxID=1286918 RepID=A0A9W8CYI3_9FUNG|nr:hypothetical protein LPJ61_003135 [Coemansia biformis]
MTDLDLDSKAILNGLVYLDQHNKLPPSAAGALAGQKPAQPRLAKKDAVSPAAARFADANGGAQAPKAGSGSSPHAIATLKVETSAVLKELARFRSCDDQTMSCFYCREWAQWVYRKQISPQAAASGTTATGPGGGGGSSGNGGNVGGSGKKKKRVQGGQAASHAAPGAGAVSGEDAAERERLERRRAARARFNAVSDLCQNLRSTVESERDMLSEAAAAAAATAAAGGVATTTSTGGSRPESPVGTAAPGTPSSAPQARSRSKDAEGSGLIDSIVEQVTVWCEGYQFPLAEVYEDLTFDFPADAFPYDDNQDPLDPALLLPALQMSKAYISLPAPSFPLLGNITSELIATHTYPTCQHTKADHPTPSELETQRLIFNSQLQKWRGEYKRSFEREMEPVWQITQLLLKSAQRIETMRVRLFARGCRTNREQFLQTIRTRTQPFAEFWARASEPYRTGKAATMVVEGDEAGGKQSRPKTSAQLAEDVDALVHTHLDNVLEVSASWSRTFLESYYGVAREFARELETILGECITMCDRRALGLKYPPPLTLQPQLSKARSAVACLLPQLEARVERVQQVVRERNSDIFSLAEDIRGSWAEASGTTVQTKLARAAHKDFRKRMRRIEHQQQVGVIGWAMRELEHLLTAPDVAAVVVDCLELLMTEAEILERAVGQVFVRKLEPTTEDLREQRQDIIDDFTEGLLTGREELAGIIGKLMLKEAWRILEANISLQRQKALLNEGGGGGGGGSGGKGKKNKAPYAASNVGGGAQTAVAAAAVVAAEMAAQEERVLAMADSIDAELLAADDGDAANGKKRRKSKKNKKKKGKKAGKQPLSPTDSLAARAAGDDDDDDDDADGESVRDPQNPFATLTWADGGDEAEASDAESALQDDYGSVDDRAPEGSATSEALPTPKQHAHQDREQEQEQEQEQQTAAAEVLTSFPALDTPQADAPLPAPALALQTKAAATASDDGAAARAARSRRGTNAARYVPGVGFVSDDGVNATSPQLIASPSLKMSPNGSTVSGPARAPVATARSATNGRMSPLSAARLVSPASRPHSPLVNATAPSVAGSDRRPASSLSSAAAAPLDKEALAGLQGALLAGPPEAMERAVSGLAYDNLVSLTLSALTERRRLADVAAKWHGAVNSVLQTYDAIASQMESFKNLCEAQDGEAARLTALLAQAAQDAQGWHERYDQLADELHRLESGRGNSADPEKREQPTGSRSGPANESASPATQALPLDLPGWGGLGQQPQQQQQQFPLGFGSALGTQYGGGFVRFPGIVPHTSGAAAARFMNNSSFAAAHSAADSLIRFPTTQAQHHQHQQQLAGLMMGMPVVGSAADLAASRALDGSGQLAAPTAPAPTSSSLLTALNAASQPL